MFYGRGAGEFPTASAVMEISLMSHVIFSSIAQEESIVHATKTFQSRRSQRLKANIS